MTEMTMTKKRRIMVVGGMDYNIPSELKDHFEIVKHITKGSKFQSLPDVEYIFVVTEYTSHNIVEAVKAGSPCPVVLLPHGGWSSMKTELERRSILASQGEMPQEAPPVVPAPVEKSEGLLSSMSEMDVWKKYGASLIEAAQTTMEPKKTVSHDEVLEILSLSGVPKVDCETFLPRLQMKGILDPVGTDRWRLMAAPGVDFDNDRVKVVGKKDFEDEEAPAVKFRGKVKSPTLIAMIAGLPKGPYHSRRQIFEEIRRYVDFESLSDWQVKKYIALAVESKIVDESNKDIYINTDPSVALKRKQPVQAVPPEAKELEKEVQKSQTFAGLLPVVPIKKEMEKTEAEKAWCYVIEDVKKERERLGNVLVHCRIEYMNGNKVLVIFLPPALAQWNKFVESTENWGLISRKVQERFSKDTVIRFMLDNGLRT